jgi:site-specific DNA recombinase
VSKKITEGQAAKDSRVPAVIIFGAKSTPDEGGSIPTQLDDCRAAAEREGREVVGTYSDENKSAYKGSRGPELKAAFAHAERLRAEGREVEIWVQHSDRLARGDGVRGAHLVEYVIRARKTGVQLRSIQDDHTFGDLVHAVLMGERNTEDSDRKSKAVRSGMDRAAAAGWRLGGDAPYGYRDASGFDDRGHPRRTLTLGPQAHVVRLMAELSLTKGDPTVARELNDRGHRTQDGRPFNRRAVQDILTNQVYAGRTVIRRGRPDEAVYPGKHPALIDPDTFDRLQQIRAARDKAPGSNRRPTGRPPSNHALARLAFCGQCGQRMYAITSPYKRKDGTRRRTYKCGNAQFATGMCTAAPIDAEPVDRAVISNLDRYLGDYDAWRTQIETAQHAERASLSRGVEAARKDLTDLQTRVEKIEADYERQVARDEHQNAEAILPILTRRRGDVELAQRRAQAAADALDSVPTEPSADALLDFYNRLSAAVRGRMDGARTLEQVNAALRDLFGRFVLRNTPAGVAVLPILAAGTAVEVEHCVDGDSAVTTVNGVAYDGLCRWPLIDPDGVSAMTHLVTGDEQITPPLRPIDVPLSETGGTPSCSA